ncbi:ABC transporter ATP-binding protein [Mobilicoccus pelagius]|uniref:Putative ABC transporter ATP-binding protein n=1 Tax=Mobilicoccus pelagius NBRC 104925 TaxID=1089455 RepID=H5UR20_9MICO|nr:ATP-binding cassette domain-containing protein [Mobilicoccus pelagius]GAB48178.1 putative ABC transporter ATP-binding protein [Mobilicoccus pelagius NBRC 104925]
MTTPPAGITVSGLTKRFGRRQVLHGVDLIARPSHVTGLLGPNGSGKSTTLRCLLGLYRSDSGTAHVEGRPYTQLRRPTTVVGSVLDPLAFDPATTGRRHLRVHAAMGGHPAHRVDDCLTELSMTSYADTPVGTWSTGMRQRLVLATALLGDPRVVVLDEPTNGLDPEGIRWIRELLRQMADDGRTVLVSTHVLAEIESILDVAVIVRDGRTVAEGDLDRLSEEWRADTLEDVYLATAGGRP